MKIKNAFLRYMLITVLLIAVGFGLIALKNAQEKMGLSAKFMMGSRAINK